MSRLCIETLRLSHFRSWRQAEIATGGASVLIWGPNGAGKTNLLEAVSLLSPGRGLRRAAPEELARRPEAIGWRLVAGIDAGTARHEVEIRAEAGGSRVQRIDGQAEPQTALGRLMRVLWLTPAMDRLWLEGAGDRRRFLDRVTMSLHPGHAEATILYEKAMRERNRLLKEEVRDPGWYEALEAQMARAGVDIMANRADAVTRLSAAQEGAETAFPRAGLALIEPEGAEPEVDVAALAAALARGRGRDRAAGRSLTGPHRTDLSAVYAAKGVAARLCSTGEQKALLISLVLANARALAAQTGAAPVLLMDEVAAHLDSARRAALHEEIGALGAQAWMTGTGAELFEAFSAPALRLCVEEGAAGSVLSPDAGGGV